MSGEARYRLLRRIGAGGAAEVYEAALVGEHGFERKVAVKRLLEIHGEDAAMARSFVDEARIASKLHHANIVGVFDFGLLDGAPILVSELVDGLDLRGVEERASAGEEPFSQAVALHVATEVAHGLHYAHEAAGVVHRDVSPENVLISWQGDVKLTDFGIMKGKHDWMAPEQRAGGSADVDRRADVFAAGCLLHWMVAGRSPVSWGRPVAIDPHLEDDLAAIIERATEERPADRHKSAAELAKDCGRALVRRLEVDARSTLVAFMDRVKDRTLLTPMPLLDQLFNAELLFTGVRGDVREFKTMSLKNEWKDPEPDTVVAPEPDTLVPPLPPKTRPR